MLGQLVEVLLPIGRPHLGLAAVGVARIDESADFDTTDLPRD
ncbi:hypothetical protein AB0F91_45945 [Amycolatopsis sp. NPDC023774]